MAALEKFRLVRRFSQTKAGTASIAISANTLNALVVSPLALPVMEPEQALRIIASETEVRDANQTHFITQVSASMELHFLNAAGGSVGPALRVWQPNFAPTVLGGTGVKWSIEDDEYLYGTDYIEMGVVGSIPGSFGVLTQGDYSNSDGVAAHTISGVITLLVEFYQRSPQA